MWLACVCLSGSVCGLRVCGNAQRPIPLEIHDLGRAERSSAEQSSVEQRIALGAVVFDFQES